MIFADDEAKRNNRERLIKYINKMKKKLVRHMKEKRDEKIQKKSVNILNVPTILNALTDEEGYDVVYFKGVPYAKAYELYYKIAYSNDNGWGIAHADSEASFFRVKHEKGITYLYKMRAVGDSHIVKGRKYVAVSKFSNEITNTDRSNVIKINAYCIKLSFF